MASSCAKQARSNVTQTVITNNLSSFFDTRIHSQGLNGLEEDTTIIAGLRSLYDDVIHQPLPEYFGRLVSSLEKIENRK